MFPRLVICWLILLGIVCVSLAATLATLAYQHAHTPPDPAVAALTARVQALETELTRLKNAITAEPAGFDPSGVARQSFAGPGSIGH